MLEDKPSLLKWSLFMGHSFIFRAGISGSHGEEPWNWSSGPSSSIFFRSDGSEDWTAYRYQKDHSRRAAGWLGDVFVWMICLVSKELRLS